MVFCGRCGHRHYADAWCGARNAKCLKCFKYGHFARLCRTSVTDPTVRYNMQAKKNRDTERMTAFFRRKDFANLPFNMLTNNELRGMRFNSLRQHQSGDSRKQKQEKEVLCVKVSGLEMSNSYLKTENSDMKVNLKSSEEKLQHVIKDNRELQSASNRKDNRIKQLLNQQNKLVAQQEKDKKKIEDKEIENSHLYRENLLLKETKSQLDDANNTIESLHREIKDMEYTMHELCMEDENDHSTQDSAYIEKLEMQNEAMCRENLKLADVRYQLESANKEVAKLRKAEKLKERDQHEKKEAVESRDKTIRNLHESINTLQSTIRISKIDISNLTTFMSRIGGESKEVCCIACGSSYGHYRHACSIVSIGTECAVCKRHNHFTVFCPDLKIV